MIRMCSVLTFLTDISACRSRVEVCNFWHHVLHLASGAKWDRPFSKHDRARVLLPTLITEVNNSCNSNIYTIV
jgi:hypothetical protein